MGKGINTTCDEGQTAIVASYGFKQGANHSGACGGLTEDCEPPLTCGQDHNLIAFTKSKRAQSTTDDETWVPGEVSPTMSCFDQGDARATTVVAYDILGTLATNGGKETDCHTALRSRPPGQSEASTTTVVAHGFTYSGYSNQPAWITGDRTDCLPASGHSDGSHQGVGVAVASCGVAGTLHSNPGSGWRSNGTPVEGVAISNMAVRRLTPKECERLQGFPDGYTAVTYRGKPASDGPRYRALGNSMAVPVMAWIGKRIAMVEEAANGR
jgi:DNA (cytosine-5)-methyltransferase 1